MVSLNPQMRQVEEANAELELVVYNFEKGGHKFVGSVIVTLAELESGETSDEWFPLLLHPSLREAVKGELVPLLRVQMTLAAFRWDRLPPRPVDFIPDYRMPTRCGPGKDHPHLPGSPALNPYGRLQFHPSCVPLLVSTNSKESSRVTDVNWDRLCVTLPAQGGLRAARHLDARSNEAACIACNQHCCSISSSLATPLSIIIVDTQVDAAC